MELVELTDIARNHNVLHYRRTFTATAHFDNGSASTEEAPIRFTVEHVPLGPTNITVELLEHGKHKHGPEVDAIRAHVANLDSAGQLP